MAVPRRVSRHRPADAGGAPPPGPPTGRPPGADEAVSPALRTLTGYVWRLFLLAVVVYVTFTWLARLQLVVVAVFAALVLCSILLPVTELLSRYLPRGPSAALSLVLALLLVAGTFAYVGASAANQSAELVAQLQDGITQIGHWLNRGPMKIPVADLDNAVAEVKTWIADHRGALAGQVLSSAGIALELLSGLALAVFCALFFLSSGDRMWNWVVGNVPPARRSLVDGAVRAGWTALAGYTRGILIVAVTNALVVATALLILRVPLALPLAVLAFFGTFVPLIGAPIAMAAATLIALAGRGPLVALVVLVMIVLVGQFEGHVLHPLVMSRAVSLHPVVVALSVAGGAILGGIVGAVVAVPLVSTVWGVTKYLRDNGGQPGPG